MTGALEIDLVIPKCEMSPNQRKEFIACCARADLFSSRIRVFRTAWLVATLLSRRNVCYDALYTNGQGQSVKLVARLVRHRKWIHHHHTSGDDEDARTWPQSYTDSMRSADHVVACSTSNARSMGTILGRSVDSVRYLTTQFTLERQSIVGRPLRFGFFGRLIHEKGIDMIARLSEDPLLSGIEWHIWGEGTQYPKEFFHKHPKILKHDAFRDQEGLPSAISSLAAYVLLSTNPEGLPLALRECMGAGVPWIASDRGGIRDVLCDPIGTMMLPSNFGYREAFEAVRLLAGKIQSGECRGEILVDYYKTHLSPEAICRQWIKLMAP
jgi:glycosyltransferase involved in cell wall biosynthesis